MVDEDTFEVSFWNEIWGCVKFIGMPYDTVMNMPVADRKVWIAKHNMETEAEVKAREAQKNGSGNISGAMLNSYAKMEMEKEKNGDFT